MSVTNATNEEPALAALRHFRAGDYDSCVTRLEEAGRRRRSPGAEARLALNRAVAEHRARGGGREAYAAFADEMSLLAAEGDTGDPESVPSPADVCLHYNRALVLYRLGRFAAARRLLDAAMRYVDEGRLRDRELARETTLLLAEVCLRCRDPDAALAALRGLTEPDVRADLRERLERRARLAARLRGALPDGEGSVDRLLLRARQQYVNGDAEGAVATLSRHVRFDEAESRDAYAPLNNALAVLHSALGRHNLAAEYARRALAEHARRAEARARGDPFAAADRACYAYNYGSSALAARRPDDAFEPLLEAVRHFPNCARAWLRLAECCVAAAALRDRETPAHPRLATARTPAPGRAGSGDSYAIPAPSLEFAALCLADATALLPEEPPGGPRPEDLRAGPGDPLDAARLRRLRRSALLLDAYVSLRLDDPATAALRCEAATGRAPGPHADLARLYAAEALTALGDVDGALQRLERIPEGPLAPLARLGAAACRAAAGDPASARETLRGTETVASLRDLPLRLYAETCAGNADGCRALLKRRRRSDAEKRDVTQSGSIFQ